MMEEIKVLRKKFNDVVHEMVKLEEQIDYLLEVSKPKSIDTKRNKVYRTLELDKVEVTKLIRLACTSLNVSATMVYSKSRKRQYTIVRQILMYLLVKNTSASYSIIGSLFGRDHATVIHAVKVIEGEIEIYYKTSIDPQGTIKTIKTISNVTHLPW